MIIGRRRTPFFLIDDYIRESDDYLNLVDDYPTEFDDYRAANRIILD
jgi:hypothetical protein